MANLTTRYLGLELKNPLIASASPLSKRVDLVKDLEKAGAAAVIMYSLFEEQVSYEMRSLNDNLVSDQANYHEAMSYYPHLGYYNIDPEQYVQHLYLLKHSVDIPVFGSINGVSTGGWLEYAHDMELAGADALELNLYYLPTDLDLTGAALEETYINMVRNVRDRLTIPFALKLNPFYTSLPNFSKRVVEAGANGLVFFNRFYQPDLDPEKLKVVNSLDLSTTRDLRLPLRWISLLYGRLPADLALSGGIHSAQEVVKAIMAGASATMVTSELLQNGIGRIGEILIELENWLEEHNYQSLSELRGVMSQQAVIEPAAFERASYLKILNTFK
jgi:dihydroorotate dehydrogenase (fumarate)